MLCDEEEPTNNIYTATNWDTAVKLHKYSYYQGLEEYRYTPGKYQQNTEIYGIDKNFIIQCYRTRKN